MKRHLVNGFEGLLRRVMYIFDDALVFVEPPPGVAAADSLALLARKHAAMRLPGLPGESSAKWLAEHYVDSRKFADIKDFARQFGDAGFGDPRITSAMVAEQLQRTTRVPHTQITGVHFVLSEGGLHPHTAVHFARTEAPSELTFAMRYRLTKAREAHAALAAVLGSRVHPLIPV